MFVVCVYLCFVDTPCVLMWICVHRLHVLWKRGASLERRGRRRVSVPRQGSDHRGPVRHDSQVGAVAAGLFAFSRLYRVLIFGFVSSSGPKGKCWAGRIPPSSSPGTASAPHRGPRRPAAPEAPRSLRRRPLPRPPLPPPPSPCRAYTESPDPSTGAQRGPAPPTRSSSCCC